jgi:hypothetical protein
MGDVVPFAKPEVDAVHACQGEMEQAFRRLNESIREMDRIWKEIDQLMVDAIPELQDMQEGAERVTAASQDIVKAVNPTKEEPR